MQQLTSQYRGVTLLINLNWDRLLYVAAIAVALLAGAFIGCAFTQSSCTEPLRFFRMAF